MAPGSVATASYVRGRRPATADSLERGSDVGVRDFAIIVLVARLGLRSIEVARLELRDVDWRAGELIVRGKGRRQDRLALPDEVGAAWSTICPAAATRRALDICS